MYTSILVATTYFMYTTINVFFRRGSDITCLRRVKLRAEHVSPQDFAAFYDPVVRLRPFLLPWRITANTGLHCSSTRCTQS